MKPQRTIVNAVAPHLNKSGNIRKFFFELFISLTVFMLSYCLSWGQSGNDCGNVQDLAVLNSPYTSTTVGYTNNFNTTHGSCLTGTGGDRVFKIDVPVEAKLFIGQSSNSYDSRHRIAYGGSCPGSTVINSGYLNNLPTQTTTGAIIGCLDDNDLTHYYFYNTTGLVQTVYWIQDGHSTGQGNFTLEWLLVLPPSTIPTITATGTLNPFAACAGTASSNQQLTVSGSNLSGNISILPPSGFEVSTTSDFSSNVGTSAAALSIGTAPTISTTLYVRMVAGASGSPSGDITFTSSGATNVTRAVSGVVSVSSAPAISISTASSTQCTGVMIDFTSSSSNMGGGTAAYQWKLNGVNIPSATAATYSGNSFSTADVVSCTLSVSGGCVSSNSASSNDITLTINPLPSQPNPLSSNSPQCSSVGVDVSQTGSAPAGVTWYWQTTASGTSTASSTANTNLTASGTAYLRAQTDATGCWSASSASLAVIVNSPPAQASLSFPSNGSTTVQVAPQLNGDPIQWGVVSEATDYKLFLNNVEQIHNYSTTYSPGNITFFPSQNTSLSYSTTYTWYVVAVNGCGDGLASATRTFTTVCQGLSGSVNVGAGEAYTSLTGSTGLFASINSCGLAGPLTINITSNLSEDGATKLNQHNSMSSTNTITIQPSGGDRTISGTVAGKAMIDIYGADYVTIDGLNTGGNSLTISNLSTSSTAPTSTIYFNFSATNNTLTNLTILGSSGVSGTTSTGAGVISFGSGSGTGNVVSNCVIGKSSGGAPKFGIYAYTSSTSQTGLVIEDCEIQDASVYSAYIGAGYSQTTIDNCNFYFTAANAAPSSNWAFIYLNNTSASQGLNTITNNNIGFTDHPSLTAVSTLNVAASYAVYGIYLSSSTGVGYASTISGNTIAKMTLAGTASSSKFYGIYLQQGIATISNNTIGGSSSDQILASVDMLYGIYSNGSDGTLIHGNNISHMWLNSVSSPDVIGIYSVKGNIYNNRIYSIGKSADIASSSLSGGLVGIYVNQTAGANPIVYNNMIGIDCGNWTGASMVGLLLYGPTKAFFNSVRLSGENSTSSGSVKSACVYQGSISSGSLSVYSSNNIELKNNIFTNYRNSASSQAYVVGVFLGSTFSPCDYNIIDVTAGPTTYIGYSGAYRTTFALWNSGSSKDLNGQNIAAPFISSSDLHLLQSNQNAGLIYGNATDLGTTYSTDIDGDTRSVLTAGADHLDCFATTITQQPTTSSQSGLSGATLSVSATGWDLNYQWYSNSTASNAGGTLISGATSATYTTTPSATTYYYCVVTGTCGSVTSDVSGSVIGIPTLTLSNSSCGTTLSSLGWGISANNIPNAAAYEFQITDPSAGVFNVVSPDRWITLSEATGMSLLYGSNYSIKVRVQSVTGTWGNYGSACNVNTPSIPATVLSNASCGNTLPSIGWGISATNVAAAAQYMFEITAPNNATPYEVSSSDRWITLSEATGMSLLYASNYSIRVKVQNGTGLWGNYGSACTVTTPSLPTTTLSTASCGTTLPSIGWGISATNVAAAAQYMFEITAPNNATPYEVSSADRWITLSEATGMSLLYASNYSIRVKVQNGDGAWGNYSGSCTVSTPSLPTTTLSTASCGTTLPSIGWGISATNVAAATKYRFNITVPGNTTPYVVESVDRWITLSEATGMSLLYGTTYSMTVQVESGTGNWGAAGASCNVLTPAIPSIGLSTTSCGATLPSLGWGISATNVAAATQYEFQIIGQTGAQLDVEYYVISPDRWITLSEGMTINNVPLVPQNNHEYVIRVRAYSGTAHGEYAESGCVVLTPITPQGLIVQDQNPQAHKEATQGIVNQEEETLISQLNPSWTATATSNPFEHSFKVNLNGAEAIENTAMFTATLTDMSGKVYTTQTLSKEALTEEQFGQDLAPGMYMLILRQGEELRVLRVMKR